ncbi:MAG: peptide ABC transporter substrate-binding protein [Longimicrobiales bacterium]|nr:peptide ABC transporter substrate-binding protein [Longimicrobiales bacterium]
MSPRHPGSVSSSAAARVLAASLLAAVTVACSPGEPRDPLASPDGRKILRVAYEREVDVLNALTSQMLVDIHFSMVEGLVTTDENNAYVPVLAREIPTMENGGIVENADGTVEMTWPLQEDVRWHDGEPFTSEDVCFTWKFVTDEGSQVYNRDWYLGIVGCSMPDQHTVVFTWDGPYGYYAGLFEAILPEHVLGGMTTEEIVNYTPYNRGDELVGTGPFVFAEWRSGEYIRVVRNEDYWRGPDVPAIDAIVWSFVPDSNTRLNAMKAGQYHYARLEPTHVEEVRDLEGYTTHLVSSNTFMHLDLSLNTARSETLFSDPEVRRAIFYAIDRHAIADQLMEGTVRVADTPINPTSPYHNEEVVAAVYDPEEARRLLDAAGWEPGADGIRTKDGQRFSFTMLNRAGTADRIAIAQVIQAQLKDVGIEVDFRTLESAAWTQTWRTGDWEAVVSAWFLPADPSFTGLYACGGPNNMTGFCNPELDEVMEASDRGLAFEDRKPLLDEAQRLLAEDGRMLPLYYNVIPELVSDRVTGYRGSGTNFGSFWNLWQWDLRTE